MFRGSHPGVVCITLALGACFFVCKVGITPVVGIRRDNYVFIPDYVSWTVSVTWHGVSRFTRNSRLVTINVGYTYVLELFVIITIVNDVITYTIGNHRNYHK